MKKMFVMFVLLAMTVQAATLADWPRMFVSQGKFSAKYVIGEEAPSLDVVSATVISTSLARFENITTEIGTSTLDSEVPDVTKINAIVIGSACENSAAAKLLGNPEPCHEGLIGNTGYIKIYQANGRIQLLITGLNEKDRNAAAKFLANQHLGAFNLTEYSITSNSGSTKPVIEQRVQQTIPTPQSNVSNQTPSVQNTTVQEPASEPKETKPKIGPYEPLDDVPKAKKKGFFEWLWDMLTGIFT